MEPDRLATIVRLAEAGELAAAVSLTAARTNHRKHLDQLEELRGYRGAEETSLSAGQLSRSRDFQSRMMAVIDSQERVVSSLAHDLELKSDTWRQSHARHQSLELLRDRAAREVGKRSRGREQIRLDELSLRRMNIGIRDF